MDIIRSIPRSLSPANQKCLLLITSHRNIILIIYNLISTNFEQIELINFLTEVRNVTFIPCSSEPF